MNTEPTIVTPDGSMDLSSQLPDIDSMMSNIIGPFMWVSIAFTVLLVVLYMVSMARRRKVERAILDMQKVLNEMNERDKARSPSQPSRPLPEPLDDKIIAAEGPKKETLS